MCHGALCFALFAIFTRFPLVPKKALGEYWFINHLFHPQGLSVNDAIPDGMCTVKYSYFDHAVWVVHPFGWAVELAKCGIKSALRLHPVHPQDFNLLDFHFKGQYYMDRALPME